MKIALIAPGIMPIPPSGWGAVEMLIWDYYNILSQDHDVSIINIPNRQEIIEIVNSNNFDAVHLHYDVFIDIIPYLRCPRKIVSSHYPFINHPEFYSRDGYDKLISQLVDNTNFNIFASSKQDIDTFVKFGAKRENTFLSKLGINTFAYAFYERALYNQTICFSQIVDRKRQRLIQDLEDIVFYGRLDDHNFKSKNYKGELDRDTLNLTISKYDNFILLSSHENTTPLAVKEALASGLGVVVSEAVAKELDTNQSFISVIPESKINDLIYIKNVLHYNRIVSRNMRDAIRQYAFDNFDLRNLLKEYILKISSL